MWIWAAQKLSVWYCLHMILPLCWHAKEFLQNRGKAIRILLTAFKLCHIGFGTPGALEPATQTMKNCNTTCLNGRTLKADLEQSLGVPVSIANDANCFALAETLMGAVPKAYPNPEIAFGIIMGTGVGGGVVVNGRVLNGRQSIAGE